MFLFQFFHVRKLYSQSTECNWFLALANYKYMPDLIEEHMFADIHMWNCWRSSQWKLEMLTEVTLNLSKHIKGSPDFISNRVESCWSRCLVILYIKGEQCCTILYSYKYISETMHFFDTHNTFQTFTSW